MPASDRWDSAPVVNGIRRFVPSDNYAADFGLQWNRFRQTQLDSFTGIPISHDRMARCFRGELPKVKGKRVLEAGSGAGRFTEILLDYGAKLDSFDYSNAVEANWANNNKRPFTLVQADIMDMPFEREAYDYVVCLGVIQHTPDSEKSIEKLYEMVKPGGALVIDHYRRAPTNYPWPLGNANALRRRQILALPAAKRWDAVKKLVDRWFPIYWRFRDNRNARRILTRLSGIVFHYPGVPLRDRESHYQWSLLDTHDATTDYYRRFRTPDQIRATLESLGAEDIHVWAGGNGTEAMCRKPRKGRRKSGV